MLNAPLYIHRIHGLIDATADLVQEEDRAAFLIGIYGTQPCYDNSQSSFQPQVKQLMEKLREAVLTIDPSNDHLDALDDFQEEFIVKEEGHSKFRYCTPEYFKNVKHLLEKTYILLAQKISNPHENDQTTTLLNQLTYGMNMCAPGLPGHLEEICTRLSSQNGLADWLAELRTITIEQFADQYYQERPDPDFHVHMQMTFIKHANEMGLNLLKASHEDVFQERVTEQTLQDMLKYFIENYTPESIIDHVHDHYKSQLIELLKLFSPVEQDASLDDWLEIPLESYHDFSQCVQPALLAMSLFPDSELGFNELFELYDEDTHQDTPAPQAEHIKLRILPQVSGDLKAFISQKLLNNEIFSQNQSEALSLDMLAQAGLESDVPVADPGESVEDDSVPQTEDQYNAFFADTSESFADDFEPQTDEVDSDDLYPANERQQQGPQRDQEQTPRITTALKYILIAATGLGTGIGL